MAITTVERVNIILGTSGKDDIINILIPLVEQRLEAYRGKKFNGEYEDGIELVAIQLIALKLNKIERSGISSESLRGYSVSFSDVEEVEILKNVKRYAKVV